MFWKRKINRNEGRGEASGSFAAHNRTGDQPGTPGDASPPIVDDREVAMANMLFALLKMTPFDEFAYSPVTDKAKASLTLPIDVDGEESVVTVHYRYGAYKPTIWFRGIVYTHDALEQFLNQYDEWTIREHREQVYRQMERDAIFLKEFLNRQNDGHKAE